MVEISDPVLSSLTHDSWELSLQRAQLKIDVPSDEPVWTAARQELWRRVEQHDFEPDTPLNFTAPARARPRLEP